MSAGAGPRVLVVGYNACDVVVPVAGAPQPDAKIEAAGMLMGGGGPAATAAVALARLGAQVVLVTPLAADPPGRLQEAELLAAGVDLSLSPRVPGHASPLAVILADAEAESRTIFWSRGDLPHLPADAVDPAVLAGCDMLYVDGHEPDLSLRLARAARRRGLPVVFDAGSVRPGTEELVAEGTDVIGSRRFACDLTGEADPRAALELLRGRGPARAATTFGEGGVLGLDAAGEVLVPAFAVAVRDTTGAGDAFHAGYAYARLCGEDFAASLRLGAAVAALKCTGWGGRRALPDAAAARRLRDGGATRPLAAELARGA